MDGAVPPREERSWLFRLLAPTESPRSRLHRHGTPMPGFFERLETAIGKEMADIATFAHDHFQGRMGDHGHTGMALIETIAEVCRNHPNIVGIGAGVLVERLLVAEKHAHDAHLAALT